MNVKNIEKENPNSIISINKQSENRTKIRDLSQATNLSKSDMLEISNEGKKLLTIKSKIEKGFYNTNEILIKTAQKIYKYVL